MSLNKTRALSTARQYLLQKKLQAAIDIYREIIEADPSDLSTINTLGDLYVSTGRIEDALTQFSRVAEGYLAGGSLRSAIAMLKKILALDAENFEIAIKLADTYARAGLPIEARHSYVQIADGYTRKGQMFDALRVYCRIVQLDPSNASIRVKLGELYLREGMTEQAYEAFVTAARQLEAKGEIKRAANVYKEALAIRPSGFEALTGLRKLTGAPDASQPDERLPDSASMKSPGADPTGQNATVWPQPAQASSSPSPPASVSELVVKEISKAEILVAIGKVSQAVSMLRDVLRTEPNNVAVHIKLTDIYLRTGMMVEAAQECLKLARIHQGRGEHERARDYEVRASRLAPSVKHASADLKESAASPADNADLHTINSRAPVAYPYESQPNVPQVTRRLEPRQAERSESADPAIPRKEIPLKTAETFAESLPPVAPSASIREEQSSSPEMQVELVVKPRQELAVELASHQEPTVARALPARLAASPLSEKKRGRFYTALALISLMVLAAGALVGRSAYEANLDKQYQELTMAASPLPVPSPPLPATSEDSESLQHGGSLVVVVTPSLQPETTLRTQKPELVVAKNEQPISPQAFSASPRPPTEPSPPPPRIAINHDGRAGSENTTPAGMPILVPTGVPTTAPAPVEPPPKVVAKAPGLLRGGVVKRVQPTYPVAAKGARVSGVVTVELSINEQGDVTSARATSGPPLLRNAAVSAARGWKFKPSTQGGVPVKTTTVIAFDFNL